MALDPNHDPASPLGYDVDVDDDMVVDGRACSGARLVGNALVHRLMADTLPLIEAPDGEVAYGEDVRKWVGECTTPARAIAKVPRVVAVLSRDPRVDAASLRVSITVKPSITFANGSAVDFAISITAQTTTGLPIAQVIGVSKVSVELLSQGT
jgi:hypothetical protein